MNSEVDVLEMKNVYRSFKQGGQTLQVLRGVNLDIKKGEIVARVPEADLINSLEKIIMESYSLDK